MNCKQCNTGFEIRGEDRAYYKRIDVPEPTLCPDCRQQRRLVWRNERYLYKRKCDFSGKEIISMYPPDSPFKVYDQESWWSDRWDALTYGRDFDFSRPFFEQFRELQLQVPRLALVNKQSENATYTNHSGKNKNCYMSAVTFDSEDIYYSDWVVENAKNCFDSSYLLGGCQNAYQTYYAWSGFNTFFCDFIRNCSDAWFCYDCFGVKNSFMCWNLRNKEYCIRNQQYAPQDYAREMAKIFPLTHTKLQEFLQEYQLIKETKALHPASYQVQCQASSGDLLFESKNCFYCFDVIKSEDSAYNFDAIGIKDSFDNYHVGWGELFYECHAISKGFDLKCCHFSYDNANLSYADCVQNSRDCFGCVSLNHQQYCILNKQYSKADYEALVPKIIAHMKQTGEWGEFFPIHFSPFAYNQSRAQEYYPLTPDSAAKAGWRWSDYQPPVPRAEKTIPADRLPELVRDVPDDILNWAITCEATGKPFKLISQELKFYRDHQVPVPHFHPDERYFRRIHARSPRQLWQRACGQCQKPVQAPYAPERPERVYCEACYQKEVY